MRIRIAFAAIADVFLARTVDGPLRALAQATGQLQSDRDRLAHALDGSRLALWEMDVTTGAVELSVEWSRIIGAPEGVTRTTLSELQALCDPADVPAYEQAVWAVIKGAAETFDMDHRVRRLDGSEAWIRTRGKVTQRDAAGRALRMAGTNSDVGRRMTAEAQARESQARLQTVMDNLPIMINLIDRDSRFVFANRRYLEFFGRTEAQVVGRTLAEVAGDEAMAAVTALRPELEAGRTVTHERKRIDGEGRERHFEIRLVPRLGPQGEYDGHFALIDEVTGRWAAARALAESAAELQLVIDGVDSLIGRLDLDGRIVYANRRYHDFFGLAPGALVGRRVAQFAGADAQKLYEKGVARLMEGQEARYGRAAMQDGREVHLDIRLVPHRTAQGALDSVLLVAHDVTAQKVLEGILQRQALSDPLTGLSNKRDFDDRLGQSLARARRQGRRAAILFADLDDFKPVNDRLGHAAGDSVLKEVARRILACVRAGDTVARLGGDEFAILLEEVALPEDASRVAAKVIAALELPLVLEEGQARISCSVGIAIHPDDGVDAGSLKASADAAMYRAKQAGKGRSARGAHAG
jgi:diguanylate cyclase (GGDEF)-like protein/PAS domain S-box-containing protein